MDAVFSVDVERDLHTEKFDGIEKGIPKLIKILEKYLIKATFFVTGETIKKYPLLFKNLNKKGHEIAVHSYSHLRYDQLNMKEKEKEIKKTISVYHKLFKKKPKGFRAPQHSIDNETLVLLEEHNFKYDSSKVPLNLMLLRHLFKKNSNKKNIITNFLSKLKPYRIKQDFFEIPRTAFFISTGGFELKLYPRFSYKLLISINKLLKIPLIFMMHSWDMIEIPQSRITKLCSCSNFERKLKLFLEYSTKKVNYMKIGGTS